MGQIIESNPSAIIVAQVGSPTDLSATPFGGRRRAPIIGGTVSGRLVGQVIPGGADWQTVRSDGCLEIDARYVLDIGGDFVEVATMGLRTATSDVLAQLMRRVTVASYKNYFRTAVRSRTSAADLAHLKIFLAIAVGERLRDSARLTVHVVL